MRNHLIRVHEIDVSLSTPAVRATATDSIEALYTKLLIQLGSSKDNLDQEILRRTVNQEVVNQTLWIYSSYDESRFHVWNGQNGTLSYKL
jgi:uncharacterized membrane protein YheB (UPF0754 family)